MYGYQFNRQYPLGNYIVDFICRKLYLIIEIDGNSHFLKSEADFKKETYLKGLGYTILRFSEGEVVHKIDDVVSDISYAVEAIEQINTQRK